MMKAIYIYYILFLNGFYCFSQKDTTHLYSVNEDTTHIRIVKLKVNSNQSDFSPVLINNQLLFASSRPNTLGVKFSDNQKLENLTDLFISDKKDSLTFKNVSSLSKLNTKYNEGPFTLSLDGRTIFYTGNSYITNKKEPNKLTIYFSENINGNWTKPIPASFCKEHFSYCHPSLSADNKTLYFCSDMEGGFGGMDIYITTKVNGIWTKPVNLGNEINGTGHELFPFISKNNLLYFSATRNVGAGGLDIYFLDLKDSIKKDVKTLNYPINSTSDDFGIWVDSLSTSGYFSTNRNTNDDDIYYFNTLLPDFNKAIQPFFKTKFCYTFFEETALETNDTTSFLYEWDFGDGIKSRELSSRHCFTNPGEYLVKLNAIEKSTGEIFTNQLTYTLSIDEVPKLSIEIKDSIFIGEEIKLSSEKCALKDYEIKNTYWSFGDGAYNANSYVKHQYRKAGRYTITLCVNAKNNTTSVYQLFKIDKEINVIEKKL